MSNLSINGSRNLIWVYFLSVLFIALNSYFIIKEQYLFSLLPIVLVVIMVAVFALDKLLFGIILFTPLSIPLYELTTGLDFNMSLPTEPLLFGVLILFIFKLIIERSFDRRILLHPISVLIYVNLLWILITTISSTMFIVSLKFFVSRLWFIVGFYILAVHLFKNQKNIGRYFWFYTFSLLIVITYTFIKHSKYGLFNQEAANFAVNPLFNDHTAYGAALAMMLPVMAGLLLLKEYNFIQRIAAFVVLVIIATAIVFSYTRATWLSLIFAVAMLLIVVFRIKFRTLLIIIAGFAILLPLFWTQVYMKLEKNRQDSSSDFSKQIKSITNITTDASNKERLNRWSCAYRMFKERPVLGWGPGTYMFKYAPFQFSYERTIISTNAGDLGNAHSEYLGPLAESGVLGSLTFIAIVFATIYYSMRVYRRTKERREKIIVLSVLIGLITYYIHGILNNFLDTDKLSALFWGFTAIIVAIDIKNRNPETGSTAMPEKIQ